MATGKKQWAKTIGTAAANDQKAKKKREANVMLIHRKCEITS